VDYSITISISYANFPFFGSDPIFSPGHAAVVVNTPYGQTYAGLGPLNDGTQFFGGLFARASYGVQHVDPGKEPTTGRADFSNVYGHANVSFTLPGGASQAAATLSYIQQRSDFYEQPDVQVTGYGNPFDFQQSGTSWGAGIRPWEYSSNPFGINVCTTEADNALRVWAGSSESLLYLSPGAGAAYLIAVSDTLANRSYAPFTNETFPRPIPEELRWLQQDYAYLGGGFNSPSERLRFHEDRIGIELTTTPAQRISEGFGALARDAIDPLVANGIMQDFSFLNGVLFNTQSGQMAFELPDGFSGTTADWQSYFVDNTGAAIASGQISGLNQTTWEPWYASPTTSYNTGASWGDYNSAASFTWDTAPTSALPIILDLTGQGINITELGSSDQYIDMTGSGYQNRTAWAGAGNGVLVFDVNGNGIVDSSSEFEFTEWDPTATSDMQALRDVFDTNHNGQLDAGDTGFAAFKVLVTNANGTTTLRTLGELGIVSINLTTDNTRTVLADGSAIAGQTIFTRADGSTGAVADVSLAYDGNGYATRQTVTHNADGSTTTDVKAFNPDGSLASQTVSTTSADGLSRTVRFDHGGDGIFDQTQTIVNAVNADGSRSKTLSNFDVTGALRDRTGKGGIDRVRASSIVVAVDGGPFTTRTDRSGGGDIDHSPPALGGCQRRSGQGRMERFPKAHALPNPATRITLAPRGVIP
jgi:hypothetical protein